MGYFDKIDRSDHFIFLDAVQLPLRNASWVNRVQINIQGRPAWIGCPLDGRTRGGEIRDVRISSSVDWKNKMLRTIEMNYRRAPNFLRAYSIFESLVQNDSNHLAEFNIYVIKKITRVLRLHTQFHLQSELGVAGKSTELLINLCGLVGADQYLCGEGARGYQDDSMFEKNGIEVVNQKFLRQPYGNPETFLPGLSVLDFLMKGPTESFDWDAADA